MGDIVALGLLGLLGLLLVSAGIEDVRAREIANWKNATIALLAPVWWWTLDYTLWPDVPVQLGLAAMIFAVFVGAFALGQMGGGDVKMIGAIALWLPFTQIVWMLIVMSLVGGLLTLVLVIEGRVRRAAGPPEIPYGVAIAVAGLLAMREPILNHFG